MADAAAVFHQCHKTSFFAPPVIAVIDLVFGVLLIFRDFFFVIVFVFGASVWVKDDIAIPVVLIALIIGIDIIRVICLSDQVAIVVIGVAVVIFVDIVGNLFVSPVVIG